MSSRSPPGFAQGLGLQQSGQQRKFFTSVRGPRFSFRLCLCIQETVSVLERTLADTSIPQGQGLDSAHQRHLAVRKSELSNSRRSSVSVTSNPDESQEFNLSHLFNYIDGFQFNLSSHFIHSWRRISRNHSIQSWRRISYHFI